MGVRIVLIGFPGVGKLTIAKELSAMVSAKIVDNHWVNNPILRLLDEDGTAASKGNMGVYRSSSTNRP